MPAPDPANGQDPNAQQDPANGQDPAGTSSTPTNSENGDGQEPEHFDREYVETLRRENAARRKREEELAAQVQQFEDRDKSEQEKLAERASTAEERAKAAETRLLRMQVALDKKVPAELVEFLTGESQEELEAKADVLLRHAKPADATDFDGGARQDPETPKTPVEAHNALLLGAVGIPADT